MRRSIVAVPLTAILAATLAGVAIATSFADNQANRPQVAGDLKSDATARFPTNKQNEPTIAVSPDGILLAGANDEQKQPPCGPGPQRGATDPANDCSFFPGVGTSGVYRSTDGTSWTNLGLLPGYTDTGSSVAPSAGALPTSQRPGTLISGGDPVIVFGPKLVDGSFTFSNSARAYYANLASRASSPGVTAPEQVAVSISDDNGGSWFDPIIAAEANGNVFNDKEDIWADRNPSSPFFGRVYASFTQFRPPTSTAEPIDFVFSTDGGLTWSHPNQVSSAFNNRTRGGRQGSVIRTGPDGTVYLFFEDSDNKIGSQQVVVISHDGGVTFSHKILVSAVNDIADPIPGANFRTDSFASAGVDQTTGAVYVAWADRTTTGGRIKVVKSTTGGASWGPPVTVSTAVEGYAFFQGLDVAPNRRVDIGYQALIAVDPATYGTGNAAINSFYVSSSNGGADWSAPLLITSAPSDPAASAQNNLRRQFWGDYNTLASTGAAAYFIYTDSRHGQGCTAVDAYQHGVDGSGLPKAKPAPEIDCAAEPQFGNTDLFVSKITP